MRRVRKSIYRVLFDLWLIFCAVRPDISKRFPGSLSSGSNGEFALWLKNEALAQFGFDEDAASSVDAAFNADLSNQVRQLIAVGTCNLEEGLYLHSPSTAGRGLLKTLFELVAEGKLSKEVAWWFLMQSSEPKAKGNIGGTGQAILNMPQRNLILQELCSSCLRKTDIFEKSRSDCGRSRERATLA